MHSGAIGIEDPDNFDFDFVLSVVVHKQSLRATFPFVVTAPDPYRVHITPIVLGLWMDLRISINLTRRCLKNFRAATADNDAVSEAELDQIDQDVAALIDNAVAEAKAAPRPSPDDVTTDVYINYRGA